MEISALDVQLIWMLGTQLECSNETGLGAMTAEAYISGQAEPCSLTVRSDHAVEGRCEQVPTGEVRPLLVVYWLLRADVSGAKAAVAYLIGAVDLRREALPATDSDLTVVARLGAESLVFEQEVINQIAISGNDCVQHDETDAWQWAACLIRESLGTQLDFDGDGISNLEDVCWDGVLDGAPDF